MEKLGQVPVELRFSSKELVKGVVAELTRNLLQASSSLNSGLCLEVGSLASLESDNGSSHTVDVAAQVLGFNAPPRSDRAGS